MTKTLTAIRQELKKNADPQIKQSAQRFFKEKVKIYGLRNAVVTKIAKKYWQEIKKLNKEKIFNLCDALFASAYMEESFIACHWSYRLHSQYEANDFYLFEKWIQNYINNWASCDTFCNHTVGALIIKYPQYLQKIKKWTKSPNRWLKRAAAVSLIVPAKKGQFLQDALIIADLLLKDQDDLVQKGYGWLLKEESRKNQPAVFDYVMKNKKTMPRTALRYAIEKMPPELKKRAMARD